MTSAFRADEPDDDTPKLSARFWILWWAAVIAVVVSVLGGLTALIAVVPRTWTPVVGAVSAVVFGAAVFGLALYAGNKRQGEDAKRPASRRYMGRFIVAMGGYIVALNAGFAVRAIEAPAPLLWLAALAPAAFLLLLVRALALLAVEENDEFLRERFYRMAFHATSGTLAICTVWGFLSSFNLVPGPELWAVFPIWATCLWPAHWIERRRYA